MARDGEPDRPRPERARLPGHREAVKEDRRGIGEGQRGPHLVLLARDAIGYRSLCRLISRANLAGTKAMPRLDHALLVEHTEGLVALSGCREGEIARRLRVGDREGARGHEGEERAIGLGEHSKATFFDHHRVFDTDSPESLEIDAGFDRHYHPGLERIRGARPEAGVLVHVEPHPVSKTMLELITQTGILNDPGDNDQFPSSGPKQNWPEISAFNVKTSRSHTARD